MRYSSTKFLLIFCIWLGLWKTSEFLPHGENKSIYTYKDNVSILYSSNLTDFIVNQHKDGKKVQLIQFYNSYCGHCQSFAPIFRKFINNMKKWDHLISISVADCSAENNLKICQDYNIMYYPTLRTFWFKPTVKDVGEDLKDVKTNVKSMRHGIIKWITDSWKLNNIPNDWPQLVPLIANNKEELLSKLQLDENHSTLIVVEKDTSYLGRELMMDFSKYRNQLHIYRMVESDVRLLDQLLPNSLDNFKLPFLLSINNADKQFKIIPRPLMNNEDEYNFFYNLIKKKFIKNFEVENISVEEEVMDPQNPAEYSNRIYMADLHNAIRYALFHEVMLKKQINVDQINALIRFLSVIYDNFRFQNDKTRQFIKHLHDWLEKTLNNLKQSNKSRDNVNIDTNDMLTTMNIYEEYYHFPELKKWHACADVSNSKKRSYPCSLWTLFHVLSVAEYRRSNQSKQWLSLHPTLYAMREYIKHFFACTECSNHFVSMASDLENRLTYSNSSVLWLWRSHNKVNARLKGSSSEDPSLPKRQFPTYEECSYCYRHKPDASLYNNASQYLTFYDEEKVLQFLVNHYSVERIVIDNDEFENHGKQQESEINNQKEHGSPDHTSNKRHSKLLSFVPFTSTDYSIIFAFYIVSIMLLVSLCLFFKIRINKKKRRFNF